MYLNRDELYDLYITQNKTKEEVASILGCCRDTITDCLHKYSIDKSSIMKQKIYDLYINEHKSTYEIAVICKCSTTTIKRYLHKCNIPTSEKCPDKDILYKLYISENKSQSDIAKIYNCTQSTICNYLTRYSIFKEKHIPTKDELYDLYITQNKSQHQIAEIYDICKDTVCAYLKKYNIIKASPAKDELYDLYITQNKSQEEIAKQYNCSATTIGRYLKQYNIFKEKHNLSKEILIEHINLLHNKLNRKPTVIEIAEHLNYNISYIGYQINKWNLNDMVRYRSHESNLQKEIKSALEEMFIMAHIQPPIILINNTEDIYPKEIDIYLPEYKLGVEVNGGFWHSEKYISQKYHYNKSKLAYDQGIFIYHIFSYEWVNKEKRQKIINQLKNLLQINAYKIYARKCTLKEIDITSKRIFLNNNHIQGDDSSKIKLGLFYNDELVSLMTFTKPRFNKNYTWELSRYCSKANCNVIGAASKLFKYFIDHYLNDGETVISYSDIAKTKGSLYEKLGFEFIRDAKPNYIWWKSDGDVKTRYQSQMKNEVATMHSIGYYRLYDCGNKVWVYSNMRKEKMN